MDQSCVTCSFVLPMSDKGNIKLFCRRYPPLVVLNKRGEPTNASPQVQAIGWCGEYRPARAAPPKAGE